MFLLQVLLFSCQLQLVLPIIRSAWVSHNAQIEEGSLRVISLDSLIILGYPNKRATWRNAYYSIENFRVTRRKRRNDDSLKSLLKQFKIQLPGEERGVKQESIDSKHGRFDALQLLKLRINFLRQPNTPTDIRHSNPIHSFPILAA